MSTASTTCYNVLQVMERVGICRDAVYRAINEGKLPARKFGKRTLILEADLQAFIESLPRLRSDKAA